MTFERKKTREVQIGKVLIGGSNKIAIQSMNNTLTTDVEGSLEQIKAMAEAGCDISRVSIPDIESAQALSKIVSSSPLPVVADIHFDYRLALEAMENGADKIRINPGNIGGDDRLGPVVKMAAQMNIPIRIGVNSGSVDRKYLKKYPLGDPRALAESALDSVRRVEALGYDNLVVSVKSSDPLATIQVFRLVSEKLDYPLHLGVTEAGSAREGIIRSSVGIGSLLAEGIGDTIRISLTGDPVEEVRAALVLLDSLDLRRRGVRLISCPTCARTEVNMISLVEEARERFKDIKTPLKVAIMGCPVNGPGEAKGADVGIAGGKNGYVLFKEGKLLGKIDEGQALDALDKLVRELAEKDHYKSRIL